MKIRQKVNLLKQGASKALVFLLIGVLLGSYVAVLLPQKASADTLSGTGKFEYSDTKASNVLEVRSDGTQRYTRVSGSTQGYYNGGDAQGFNGCTAIIHVKSNKYDGSTSAEWYASCIGGKEQTPTQPGSKNITIAKAKNYTGSWIDHSHISVDGIIYYDNKTDPNESFTATTQDNSCPKNIINNFQYTAGDIRNSPSAQITINEPFSSRIQNCTSADHPVYFNNTGNYSKYFIWLDGGTIQTSDGNTMTFTQKNGSGPFVDSGSSCQSQLTPDPGDPTHGTLIIRYSGGNPFGSGFSPQITGADFSDVGGCHVSKPIKNVNIANPDNANQKPPGSVGAGAGAGGGNGDQLGCDASANALSWIICPVTDLMTSAISVTDDLITQQMTIPTDSIFCDNNDTCNAYYTAWVSFRNIALGLLVVAGMIIVISQAVGMEILDAYTVRRALPRLLIASLGIILSWTLMNFALTLSNNLGYGVRDLIIAPFHSLNSTISFSGSAAALVAGFAAFIVGLVAIIGAIGILLSYLATAGLAVLVAVTVLILRQLVIIVLIILSPVAIVMYIMPNTQRIFRLWWESFSKALLMFPLIAAFIAAGRVFSAISLTNSQSLFNQLVAFVAYFGPYFAIPLTFRMAGGIMSGVGNFVNQRAQPAAGRLGQYRKDKGVEKLKKARANQFVNEDFGGFGNKGRSLGKMANWVALQATDQDELLPWKAGKERTFKRGPLAGKTWKGVPGLRGYSGDLQDQLDNRAIRESQKGMQEVQQDGKIHYEGWRGVAGDIGSYKGNVTRQKADGSGTETVSTAQALTEAGFSEATPPSSITDFRRMGHILGQSDSDKERQGGSDIISHAGTLAGIKRHEGMEYADTQVMGLIAMGAAGRIEHQPAANIANSIQKRLNHGVAQRALKSTQDAASRQERPDMRDGHAFIRNASGKWESVFSKANQRSQTAYGNVMSIKGQAWSGAKAEAVTAAAPTIVAMAKGLPADGKDSIDPLDVHSIHEMITQGIKNPYNDAGQRAEWRKVADGAGLEIDDAIWTPEQARQQGVEPPLPPPEPPAPEPPQQA